MAKTKRGVISQKKIDLFFLTLAKTGHIEQSCHAVGYADSTYLRKLKNKDPDFAAKWDAALLVAAEEILIPEAHRRALEGVQEPVYHKGVIVGFKQRYSDQLLMFLIKGAMPSKYGSHIKLDAEINGKFGIAAIPLQATNDDDWEKDAHAVHVAQKTISLEESEFEEVEDAPEEGDPVIVRS